jgi:hypothetical protein
MLRVRAVSGVAVIALGGLLASVPASVASASHHKTHKKATAPKSSAPKGGLPSCSKIPASDLNTALGTNVTNAKGAPGKGSLKNIETCTYSGGAGAVLYYDAGTNKQTFEEALSSLSNVNSIKGLGTAAYGGPSSNSDPNQNQVTALFGSLEVSITADASISAEETFLKSIESQV